jgi:sec-independent protein translocase protein TatA
MPLALLGLGVSEEVLILGVVLMFFGGERMPELARGLGRILKEIRRATGDVEREFKRAMNEAEEQTVGQVRTVINSPAKTQAISAPFTPAPKPPAAAPAERPPSPHRFQPDLGEDFHSDI